MNVPASQRSNILGWHCHIYFPMDRRDVAVRLNEDIQDRFGIWDYRWMDRANFLHPTPMFRFQFKREDLPDFLEYMTLNRDGLSILIHAISGDDIVDHTEHAMWLGEPLSLGIEALREIQAKKRTGELPPSARPELQVAAGATEAGKIRYAPGDDQHVPARGRSN